MKKLTLILLSLLLLPVSQCWAGIEISITGAPGQDSVEISWSGTGMVVETDGVGSTIDFLNFGGTDNSSVFNPSITTGNLAFTFVNTDLTLTNSTNNSNTAITGIVLNNSATDNQDDILFQLGTSFGAGDTPLFDNGDDFSLFGSAVLSGISISDFVEGSFTSPAGTTGDADNLGLEDGGITLTISQVSGVPEPTSLTLFALTIMPWLLKRRRRPILRNM